MRKMILPVFMMILFSLNGFPSGISVGNGKYVSPTGFSVEYPKELGLNVESDRAFDISNSPLIGQGEEISRTSFQVSPEKVSGLNAVKAIAQEQYPDRSFQDIRFPGAEGFYSEIRNGDHLSGIYFLLTARKDLVKAEVTASRSARGFDWVAPIIHTFTYDVEAPVMEAIRLENPVWQAGTRQKIFFHITDDVSGVQADAVNIWVEKVDEEKPVLVVAPRGIKKESEDWYSVTVELDSHLPAGKYQLWGIMVPDHVGNILSLFTDHAGKEGFYQSESAQKVPVLRFELQNSGLEDRLPPSVDAFRPAPEGWEAGTRQRLYFHATDDVSGIDTDWIFCPYGLVSLKDYGRGPVSTSHCGWARSEGDGWYSVEFRLNKFLPEGEYVLKQLTVSDHSGAHVNYYACQEGGGRYCLLPTGKPSALPLFRVQIKNNAGADVDPPELHDIRFSNNVWRAGEVERLYFAASDSVSGLNPLGKGGYPGSPGFFGRLTPENGNPGQAGITLMGPAVSLGGGRYYLDIPIDPMLGPGEYYLEAFMVVDRAGNQVDITCRSSLGPCHRTDGASQEPLHVRVDP